MRGRTVGRRHETDDARVLARAAEVVGDRDPSVAARLTELAAELAMGPDPGGARLRVLGHVEVVEAGAVSPLRGRAAQLVGLLALRGRSRTEAVASHMWPDASSARTRERLRTVLARIRRHVGPVVVRDGDTLQIRPGVRVDAWEFERLATRALEQPRGAPDTSARVALAMYDHRVPPDLQDQGWARDAAQRLRDLAVALHDRLADEAEDADDPLGAVRQLQAALALAPTRDHRALRAARLLAAAGDEGRARDLLDRTADAVQEAGLEPVAEVSRLSSYLGRRAATPRHGPRP